MPSMYTGQSSSDWARSIGTTIVTYLREEGLNTFRRYKLFASINQGGNVAYNQGGRGFNWQSRYRNVPVTGNDGTTPRVFARHNLWVDLELPYRGYQTSDQITKKEMLENRGQQALINVAGRMAERLKESMEQHLAREFYVDGYAAGNEMRFHGIESFLGIKQVNGTNQTVNASTGAMRDKDAGDPFYWPSDSYAGQSTELGALGGSQLSGSWPNGVADPEYDFFSPIICNGLSTYFGTSSWKTNCVAALRECIHQAKRNDTRESEIDMVLLDRRLYIDFLQAQESKERTVVSKSTGLRALGFSDVVSLDGIDVSTEYGVPGNTGYGFSVGNMELKVMEASLYVGEGPYYAEELQSYRYACSTLANLKFKSPRNFFKVIAA